jgi:hypothetical protein
MLDMVERRYWIVLPYHLVQHLPNLRISPLGVVPQRERRPRIIVDYTFSGVNDDTVRQARPEAMQFGGALERILRAILHAPAHHGPVYLIKIDLSDGFYRIQVKPEDVPQLGVILPREPDAPPLIAFPLALPMGWTESPPYFCAATETVKDLANAYFKRWDPPTHPLESLAGSPPTLPPGRPTRTIPTPRFTREPRRQPVALPQHQPTGPIR